MLHVDIPTRPELKALNDVRADTCVSINLETTPLSHEVGASRIELANLAKQARARLESAGFAAHAEGTVGAIMTSDYATLEPDLMAAKALDKLCSEGPTRRPSTAPT